MPKLEDVRIGASPLTDRIYVGTISKKDPTLWNSKVDCTGNFIGTLMQWAPVGTIRMVKDNLGNNYEIEIKKVEKTNECD